MGCLTFTFCCLVMSIVVCTIDAKPKPAPVPLTAQSRQLKSRPKVIIDSDAGVDDTQAILLALASPNIDVIAITSTFGNSGVENTSKNALRVLSITKRTDIPVFRGSRAPLIGYTQNEAPFYGYDGLGDVDPALLPAVDVSSISEEHASNAMIRLAKKYPGEITLVCLAPLTNLAIAIKLDPDFTKNLKAIISLGGNNAGEGNETPSAEFNYYRDPEAAHIVFADPVPPISVINWEACEKGGFYEKNYIDNFYNSTSPQGQYIHKINQQKNARLFASPPPVFIFADELAVALAVDDKICAKSANWPTTVELAGTKTRGQCVVDKRSFIPATSNIRNCHTVDVELGKRMLTKMLKFDFSARRA